MTIIRVKGFKVFKDRHGKLRCYHRATGQSIDVSRFPIGSAEFFAECARVSALTISQGAAKPGTLGLLIQKWKKSPSYQDLQPKTKEFYEAGIEFLRPINNTPLLKFDCPLVFRIRDRAKEKKTWYFANQLKTTLSVLFSWAVERGWMLMNPAKGVKKLKRPKDKARANRPWTPEERIIVINAAASHVRPVLAAMLYTGIDPCDAIMLSKTKYKDGAFDLSRQKTGNPIWKPLPRDLKAIIANMPKHDAITLFANSFDKPWTKSGFDSVWSKLRKGLEDKKLIAKGLTLKGLRHTHATMLREQGESNRTIADSLGDKSESMGAWYSRDADTKENMKKVVKMFDKKHRSIVKPASRSVKP